MARYTIDELEDLESVHEAIMYTAEFNGEHIEDYVAENDYWYNLAKEKCYEFNEDGEMYIFRKQTGKSMTDSEFIAAGF